MLFWWIMWVQLVRSLGLGADPLVGCFSCRRHGIHNFVVASCQSEFWSMRCATDDQMGAQSAIVQSGVCKELGSELWQDCGSLKGRTSPSRRTVTLQPCAQHRADIWSQANTERMYSALRYSALDLNLQLLKLLRVVGPLQTLSTLPTHAV